LKSYAQYQLDLVNQRRGQELAEAALARQLNGRAQPTRASFSQVLARIGARLRGRTGRPVASQIVR
jgi:hypothetical protein